MAGMERYVTKPTGYRQAAVQQIFCWCLVGVPYYQALLVSGAAEMIWLLVLAFLLTFVVARSPAICRMVAESLRSLPLSWIAPTVDCRERWVGELMFVADSGPALSPLFQRPPPIFS
jgi:hypothetical protein